MCGMMVIMPLIAFAAESELVGARTHALFKEEVLPVFVLAREGRYDEAALAAETLEPDSLHGIVNNCLDIMKQSCSPDLAEPVLEILNSSIPMECDLKEAMTNLQLAGMRKLNTDVDALLTAIEQGKSVP